MSEGGAGRIVFGSMRMSNERHSAREWAQFLVQIFEKGITTFHASSEYESFPLFCEALAIARASSGISPKLILKVAEPHFGDQGFDAGRLQRRIDESCAALAVPRIDYMQWMWRAGLGDDPARCNEFQELAGTKIASIASALKKEGRVSCFACFPYTPAFADAALNYPWMEALVIYRNPLEQEYDHLLNKAMAAQKPVIALRPFAAGRTFGAGLSVKDALSHCFAHPGVRSAVVTFSSLAHLAEIESALPGSP